MRINVFVAQATGLSRRAADQAVTDGRAVINGRQATPGDQVASGQQVSLDGKPLTLPERTTTIMLNKPVGYVVSRDGQGSQTIYDLLSPALRNLKPVGRLDKDSSGLLLLTNDGQLANELTHPRHHKTKVYEIELDKPLASEDARQVEQGVKLDDGLSKLQVKNHNGKNFKVLMTEGRNRQIRRTFAALDYTVTKLHRTHFGKYELADLKSGSMQIV